MIVNADLESPGPFLKWAGGKWRYREHILPELYFPGQESVNEWRMLESVAEKRLTGEQIMRRLELRVPEEEQRRLFVPFLGGGAIYLSANFHGYYVGDANPHLVGVFAQTAHDGIPSILYNTLYFGEEMNVKEVYYEKRRTFNELNKKWKKQGHLSGADLSAMSALFLYLNKHCYNGLTRYNKSGKYNVPFGKYKTPPKAPAAAMQWFLEYRAPWTMFYIGDFIETMKLARRGDFIFCDPPYLPLQEKGFTKYTADDFSESDHGRLAKAAEIMSTGGVKVIICGHNTPATDKMYAGHDRKVEYMAARNISSNGNGRAAVAEALYIWEAKE